jgi:hypothetical protein
MIDVCRLCGGPKVNYHRNAVRQFLQVPSRFSNISEDLNEVKMTICPSTCAFVGVLQQVGQVREKLTMAS